MLNYIRRSYSDMLLLMGRCNKFVFQYWLCHREDKEPAFKLFGDWNWSSLCWMGHAFVFDDFSWKTGKKMQKWVYEGTHETGSRMVWKSKRNRDCGWVYEACFRFSISYWRKNIKFHHEFFLFYHRINSCNYSRMVTCPCAPRILPLYGLELEPTLSCTCRTGAVHIIYKCLGKFKS